MPVRSGVLEVEVLEETERGVRCRTKSGEVFVVPATDLKSAATPSRPSRVWVSPNQRVMSLDKEWEDM